MYLLTYLNEQDSFYLNSTIVAIQEKHEEQIRTVSPSDHVIIRSNSDLSTVSSHSSTEVQFEYKNDTAESLATDIANLTAQSDILFFAHEHPTHTSELSLVPEERNKLARLTACQSWPKEKQFIVKILYDLIDSLELVESPAESPLVSLSSSSMVLTSDAMTRQYGQETISSKTPILDENSTQKFESVNLQEAEDVAKEIKRHLKERLYQQLIELPFDQADIAVPSTSKKRGHIAFESSMNITSEMKRTLQENLIRGLEDADQEDEPTEVKKKSNLKNIGVQTDNQKKDTKKTEKKSKQKVTISESKSTYIESERSSTESLGSQRKDKDTQTHPKEKQD